MTQSRIKSATQTARISAVLLAGSAYDATNPIIDCTNSIQAELYIGYTRGAGATIGQPKFKVLVSDIDTGDVTTFSERTIKKADAPTITGGEAVSPVYTDATLMPVPAGATIEMRTYTIDLGTARRFMVLFAESGDAAHPGIVVCTTIVLVGGV